MNSAFYVGQSKVVGGTTTGELSPSTLPAAVYSATPTLASDTPLTFSGKR